VTKRREFLAAGLDHYWVVDPDEPAIVAFDITGEYAHARGDEPFVVAEPFPIRVIPADLAS
jgi:hypothetical protein